MLSVTFFLTYYVYRGSVLWCKERPHYGLLSNRAQNQNEGFNLCIQERLSTEHWNYIHYGVIYWAIATLVLLYLRASVKTICITYLCVFLFHKFGYLVLILIHELF